MEANFYEVFLSIFVDFLKQNLHTVVFITVNTGTLVDFLHALWTI